MIQIYIIYFIIFIIIVVAIIQMNNLNNLKKTIPVNTIIYIQDTPNTFANASNSRDIKYINDDHLYLDLITTGWFHLGAYYYTYMDTIWIGYKKIKSLPTEAVVAGPAGGSEGQDNNEYEYGLYNINNINSIYLNNVKLNSSNFFININNDFMNSSNISATATTIISAPITYINDKKITHQSGNTNINNYTLFATPFDRRVAVEPGLEKVYEFGISFNEPIRTRFNPVPFIKVF